MLANLVEGSFGRLFRSEVRPMELARRLAREMDEHRTQSVSRVYAPNEYDVWLSPEDRALYEGVEGELIDELCAYLLEHARRENLMLASPPQIAFHTDERLTLGEFGIEAKRSRPEEPRARRPEDAGEAPARRPERAVLVLGAKRVPVPPPGAVLGRSHECDVVLDDAGVSRRHAEIRPSAEGWTVADLGSTNGVRVNDRTLREAQPLRLGDRIELGSTEILFEVR